VQFSPNGDRFATASSDNTAALWDAATGRRLFSLKGHREVILSIAFSPDGGRVATGGADGTLRVWDTRTGRPVWTSAEHLRLVKAVAFSPGGDILASAEAIDSVSPAPADRASRVQLWDARSGKRKVVFRNPQQWFASLSFSPGGQWLAAGDSGGWVTVWDVTTGKVVRTIGGHTGWVRSVRFSPDGRRLASGGDDGSVLVWEVATGGRCLSLRRPLGIIFGLAWGPNGRWLASAHYPLSEGLQRQPRSSEVRVWDMATGAGRVVLGASDLRDCVYGLALSPDGGRLATAHQDGTVRVWSVEELLRRARPVGR
jgi:WD40 repeat protein